MGGEVWQHFTTENNAYRWKKEDGVEEPVFGPDASPQTGIPWQYWRGSQAQLTASTAPVPPGKRVSYGTQLLVQLWRKDSELTSDDEHLQGRLWITLLYPCPSQTGSPAPVLLHGSIYPQALPCWSGKMFLSPTVWTGRKEQVPSQLFSRRYRKGVLRDCIPVLSEPGKRTRTLSSKARPTLRNRSSTI